MASNRIASERTASPRISARTLGTLLLALTLLLSLGWLEEVNARSASGLALERADAASIARVADDGVSRGELNTIIEAWVWSESN
jgi:hypothetical protein